MGENRSAKKEVIILLAMFVAVGVGVGVFGWAKFFRQVPQPPFASEAERFMYGSMGSEGDRGIPYLIWLALPRIFPEYLPGPGGYASLGVVWEEGKELPAGFAKKTVGFDRVTNNCAMCHTATYRTQTDQTPVVVPTGPSHTWNLQAYIRFLSNAASDVRFNADVIMAEIAMIKDLSWVDKLLYRYLIIPFTKKAVLEQRDQFAWMERQGWADWGPGRDDPMNLTKAFLTDMPVDDTIGNSDFPSIWNLKLRDGQAMNWAGETLSTRAVVLDSAFGVGMPATSDWIKRMEDLDAWLKEVPPPKYPLPIDEDLAAVGRVVYEQNCASCHAMGGQYVGTVIHIDQIGTDRGRVDTWSQEAADVANQTAKDLGVTRKGMIKTNGYVAQPLDGVWLRGPYLHNGSVPSLRDLLEPVVNRPKVFYRGYDLIDPVNVGFVSQGDEAQRVGFRFDTQERGNGNQGHEYGVELSSQEKDALVEYLKTQ